MTFLILFLSHISSNSTFISVKLNLLISRYKIERKKLKWLKIYQKIVSRPKVKMLLIPNRFIIKCLEPKGWFLSCNIATNQHVSVDYGLTGFFRLYTKGWNQWDYSNMYISV